MYVVWMFLAISGISAFRYEAYFQFMTLSNTNSCEICFGSDCVSLNKGRCEYYRETKANDKIYNDNDEDNEPEASDQDVDNMLMDYIDTDITNPNRECIPIISQYTNCHKDNICTGCEICNCDVSGSWICNDIQRCRPEPDVIIDHTTLTQVIENLKEHMVSEKRIKRSIKENEQDNNKYEELLTWLYSDSKSEINNVNNTIKVNNNPIKNNQIRDNSINQENLETDLLVFNDILNSLNNYEPNFYHQDKSNAIFLQNNGPVSFDLLKEIDNGLEENTEDTNIAQNNNTIRNQDQTEITSDQKIINKREITLDPNLTMTNLTIDNSTTKIDILQNNILSSLNTILKEKQKEIEKLMSVKDNLILYLHSYENITISNDTESSQKNIEYPHVHFYFVEMIKSEDFRRNFPNMLERYLKKLKRDIYEVMKDITSIQRLSNSTLPHDLKILIRAMKKYVINDNKRNKQKAVKNKSIVSLRKSNDNGNEILNIVINILQHLDKDTPTGDVTVSLSQKPKRTLRRLIKALHRNDLASSRLLDPNYDVIKELKSIDKRWQSFSFDNTEIPASERLYNIKLLHLLLAKDLYKLTRARHIIEFAHSRRMISINEIKADKLILKIKNSLQKLNGTIKKVVGYSHVRKDKNKTKPQFQSENKKSESFLQRIRKLLKKSKNKIKHLINKNVSTSDAIEQIAKNNMNEINKKKIIEYEEIMRSWQNNFNMITVRKKRSAKEILKFFGQRNRNIT